MIMSEGAILGWMKSTLVENISQYLDATLLYLANPGESGTYSGFKITFRPDYPKPCPKCRCHSSILFSLTVALP